MCDNNIHQIKETADGEYSSSALGTQAEGFESEQADEPRGLEALDLGGRVEAIRSLVSIGLIHVREEIDREMVSLAGERYVRKRGAGWADYDQDGDLDL